MSEHLLERALSDLEARGWAREAVEDWADRHPELRPELEEAWAGLALLRGTLDSPWGQEAGADAAPAGATGRLTDYEIVRELGRGGGGVVYLARQRSLARDVALKMLPAGVEAVPDLRARFLRESRAAAGLRHPHIVAIHEVGEEGGRPYFTMEFVEGETLSTLLTRGPLSPERAARLLADVAGAVAHAHSRGVLHRDLKPSNILLDREGRPVVTDFGLARVADRSPGITAAGQVFGTPSYMAPEQARGEAVDLRADVWALGATLYEALTGGAPFEGDTSRAVLLRVERDEPVRPRRRVPAIPRDLETVVLKCLEKRPDSRYPSAAVLEDDLRRFLAGEPVRARPPGRLRKLARLVRRHAVKLAVAAGVALAVAGGALYWASRPAPWRLVFEDGFDREELGEAWANVLRGDVTIHDAALCSRVGHVTLDLPFPGDVRVEAVATVQLDAQHPVETSLFLAGTLTRGLRSGYSFEHADYGQDMIQREGTPVRQMPCAPLVRGGRVHLEAERSGSLLVWRVDRRELLRYRDGQPLGGDLVGFGSGCDHVHYEDLRVFQRVASEGEATLRLAQGCLRTGRPGVAERCAAAVAGKPGLTRDSAEAAADVRVRALLALDPEAAVRILVDFEERWGRSDRVALALDDGTFARAVLSRDDAGLVELLRRLAPIAGPWRRPVFEEMLAEIALTNARVEPRTTASARARPGSVRTDGLSLVLADCLRAWEEEGPDAARERLDGLAESDLGKWRCWRTLHLALIQDSPELLGRAVEESRELFMHNAVPVTVLAYAGALAGGHTEDAARFARELRTLADRPNLDVVYESRAVLRALQGASDREILPRLRLTGQLPVRRDASFYVAVGALWRGDRAAAREALARYLGQGDPGRYRPLARRLLEVAR